MRRGAIRIVVIAIMATCLAGPILQMFDHWDHGEPKGKDTETTLVIVALSAGLAIPVVSSAFRTYPVEGREIDSTNLVFERRHEVFANLPVPVSQPPPILRI